MDFDIVESKLGEHTVVSVVGELDALTAPLLRQSVLEQLGAGARGVIVDLEALTFLDSSGLSALVTSQHAASAEAASFALVCTKPATLKVLQITQLDQVFDIYPSIEAAARG